MARPYLLKKRGDHWYCRLSGEPTFHSTGETRRGEAELEAKRRWKERDRRTQRASTQTFREYSGPFFTEACPHLRRRLEEGKPVGHSHIYNSRHWIEQYILKDRIADMPIADLTRADVLDFRSRLLARLGAKRNTANKVMATLKVILHEALYRQDIERDPTAGVGHIREDRQTPGILTVEELRALFPQEGLGPWRTSREYACFALAATTGMRRGEILALAWEQVDFEAGAIRITRAWKTKTELGPPKSGKPRICPLPSIAAEALRRLHDESENIRTHPTDLVFCYDDGSRFSNMWWLRGFAGAMKKTKIDAQARRIRPHSLRHTLNTLLEAHDYNPQKIRAALGWSGEQIRENYLHLSVEHLQEQAEIVDGLFKR